MNKKLFVSILIATIIGVGTVGYVLGNEISQAGKREKDPNLMYYENNEELGKDGAIQVLKMNKEEAKPMFETFKQLEGAESEMVEYQASDGSTYTILLPPKLTTKKGKTMDWIEKQISNQALMKQNLEREPEERAVTIEEIEDLFGTDNVVYERVTGNPYTKENVKEKYIDEQGRQFVFSVDKNKIARMSVGGEKWCESRQDILDESCRYKEGKINEQEARERVLALLTKAEGEEKAKEIVADCEMQRATTKGNTFVFIYPAGTGTPGKDYQVLVVVEPVKGEVINYQNYLE